MLSKLHRLLLLLVLTKKALAAVNYDTWPNAYTSMANMFQTVPELDPINLKFEKEGKNVPEWVSGDFFIVGPGRFEWGAAKYKGFLDANAMAHKISISNGGESTSYNRKFIKSKTWEQNSKYNDIVVSEFATYGEPSDLIPHPRRHIESMLERMLYFLGHVSDNTIVKINQLYGQMMAFGESPGINILNRTSLETIAHIDINDAKPSKDRALFLTQTAHGHYDVDTNSFLNAATVLDFSHGIPRPAYRLVRFNDINETLDYNDLINNPEVILNKIEFGEPVFATEYNQKFDEHLQYMQYFHTIVVSDDFFIIPLTNVGVESVTCTVEQVANAKPLGDCYKVLEEFDAVLIVFDKRSLKEVARFKTDYLVAFHSVNAYQVKQKSENTENSVIHIDCVSFQEGGSPFNIFPLEVMNATGTDLVEKYNKYMMGAVPTRLILDMNEKPDEFGLKPIEKISLFGEPEDEVNENWQTYMKAGNEFPSVKPSDVGNENYDVFYSNGLGAMSPDRVYRSTISTQERLVWHEIGYYNSELAVIESPMNDVCVLLLLCSPFEITPETPTAFLVVLDGESLHELDRAYFSRGCQSALDGAHHMDWWVFWG